MPFQNRIEIMAPAGSFESLAAALQGGADSVYFGVGKLNMRSRATVNFSEEDLPEIVERCHEAGAKAYLTLNIIVYDEELEAVHALCDAARKAGVDAVEIHMAHGYLVSTFLSPRTNKRVDEFGGCFENRMRFSRLIIEEIKKQTEGKIAVLARINSDDEVPGGLDVHDSAAIAAYLESCGLDAIHVSRAVHIKDEYMWAPTVIHGGFSADLVEEIKRAVNIPVITVGRYTEPQFAELMVKEGRCDLVAFGRQSLADPHMPKKAKEERLEDMIPCIACLQGCVANMYAGKPLCCLTNPFLGHDAEPLKQAETPKKIMVIGGGVAGLCAAFVAKERGHEVTLYEAGPKLGGNMRLAAYPPGKGDITNMIRSYIHRCQKDGVEIKLNHEVTADFIKEENPDSVILATGSKTLVLPIEGIDNPSIIYGSDLLEGKRAVEEGLIDEVGGIRDALNKLHEMIDEKMENTDKNYEMT